MGRFGYYFLITLLWVPWIGIWAPWSGVLFAQTPPVSQSSGEQKTSPPSFNSDLASEQAKQAIAKLRAYGNSFNDRDFDGLADLLVDDVSYVDVSASEALTGSKELVRRIKQSIANEPTLKVKAEVSALRFLSDTEFEANGVVTLSAAETAPERSEFRVIMTNQNKEWKIKSISERSTDVDQNQNSANDGLEAMASLGWLKGNWNESMTTESATPESATDVSADQALRTSIREMAGGRFLVREFSQARDGGEEQLGVEVIGYDPRENYVRSWSFFADGSFANGTWQGGDDHWKINSTQTFVDGAKASGTFILRPLDEDTLSIKLVAREYEGEPLPSGKKITLKRMNMRESDRKADRQTGEKP